MPPVVALVIFASGIAGLFFLNRGNKGRVSEAFWIPTAWWFIITSRPVSQWLGVSPTADRTVVYLEGSPVDRAVFAFLEALALLVVVSRRRQVGRILRRNWAIALFFIYAAVSISWSDFPFVTLKRWIKGIGDVMMLLILLTEQDVTGAIKCLITRIGFALLPLSVLFIKYYPLLGRRLTKSWTMEPIGVAVQKNSLGQLCAFFGLGLLWCLRTAYNNRADSSRKRRLLAIGVVLPMIIWLLWMCNSLTSISALGIGSAVMFLSTRPTISRRPALVHVVIIAALAIALYALFLQPSGALIQGLGRHPTLTGRTDAWPILMSVENNRVIGAGYESFWLGARFQKVWEEFEINSAHNGYVEILLNLGWIGVTLLGFMIVKGYRDVIRAYRRDPDMGSLRIAFLVAALLTSFTEAAFRLMSPPWMVFLLATAVTPVQATEGGGRRRLARQPPLRH